MLVFSFASFGVTSYLYKFFPYYSHHTRPSENDMLGVALRVGLVGFILTTGLVYLLEPLIIRKFSRNSVELVQYFYLTIPLAFCVLIYGILEAYSYSFDKGVLTNLLRETIVRLYTLVITVLKIFGIINFDEFLKLFSLQFLIIVIILIVHLYKNGQLWIHFKTSRVTRRFRKKIMAIMVLTFLVVVVSSLRQTIDTLLLASKENLGTAGIFGLAAYLAMVLQAPYRSLGAITLPILSRAWKDKNHKEITRIYKRTSINLLCFGLFIFFCIWLNYNNAITLFGINPDYLAGKWVFFMLGIVTIIEIGTGVNGQIIGTSTYWRFELWTSLLLTAMILPLSYFLTVRYGIFGPAMANLISFSIYNFVRIWFLWRTFHMQPFSKKTLEILAIAAIGYMFAYLTSFSLSPVLAMITGTVIFAIIFLGGVYFRNISPDVKPLVSTLRKRLRI